MENHAGDKAAGRRLMMRLPQPIDPALAAEIEKESVYISPHVSRLKIGADGMSLDIELQDAGVGSEDEVRGKIERYLAAKLVPRRHIEPKVYLSHEPERSRPLTRQVYAELQRRGWLFEHGRGYVSLAGPIRRLAVALDAALALRYRQRFGAEEAMFPAFISGRVLARCDYFDSHPNIITMATHVMDDFDVLEEFRAANQGQQELHIPRPDVIATPETCLNPAACLPSYQALEGTRLQGEGRALTWQARVFRHESRNTNGLDRLAEFNVRELVFVGTDEFVMQRRQEVLEIFEELLGEWDIDCRVETATDPFFAPVAAARAFWQQAREVKYEMLLAVEPGDGDATRRIAGGSINIHEQFFGTRFDIKAEDGEPAFTGCVGVGIERWLYAILSQHGLEPTAWPDTLREAVQS
jgi:seryl-tRNA synthetase